eukprot:CAMPEP_0117439360 /NCGR_PEP_ID=MMETSP0759-20121206/2525_1 /TAXON_ID=63605 /ORGANISM="Percolomonas cosmopolitus, Strain WS" /LENGTH=1350 /DNA_ID=CAMNT_0005231073 /DNA_START=35 /DNA_END=4087 /DNA_ORIENTATION=+
MPPCLHSHISLTITAILSLFLFLFLIVVPHSIRTSPTDDDCFFGFGLNAHDAFAVGNAENIQIPSHIAWGALHKRRIISIGAGFSYSIAIDDAGNVYSFGSTKNNVLGYPEVTPKSRPSLITSLSINGHPRMVMSPIVDVISGAYRSFVRESESGFWYAFGSNWAFSLGDGTDHSRESPVFVSLSAEHRNISSIAVGFSHTTFITAQGEMFALGDCSLGQCGIEGIVQGGLRFPQLVNTSVVVGEHDRIVKIVAGASHNLVLTAQGEIIGFGNNFYGQAGAGNLQLQVRTPTPINMTGIVPPRLTEASDERIVKIASGEYHNLILTSRSRLFCFGHSLFGQCTTTEASTFTPTEITHIPGLVGKISDVACGGAYSLLISLESNTLFVFGDNFVELPNLGAFIRTPAEIHVSHLLSPNENITKVATGYQHALLLTSTGRLLSMGRNSDGCLGLGVNDGLSYLPRLVNTFGALRGSPVTHLSSLGDHIVYLDANGTCLASGACEFGQCMDATTRSRPSVEEIALKKKIYAIATGEDHTLLLTSDGQIFAGGLDSNGQLGSNTGASMLTVPTLIDDLVDVKIIQIDSGSHHSVVLSSDGIAFGFGTNGFGETGCGCDEENVRIPAPVVDSRGLPVTGVIAISCGSSHNLLLMANHSLWSWGNNYFGKLGSHEISSDEQSSSHIVSVYLGNHIDATDDYIAKISAGGAHSLILSTKGVVLSWGYNELGACGLSKNVSSTIVPFPQKVDLSHILLLAENPHDHITDISAGTSHSLLLSAHGIIIGFGNNENYATGTGRLGELITYLPSLVNTSLLPPLGESQLKFMRIYAGKERSFISFCEDTRCGGLSSLHPQVCSGRGVCASNGMCDCLDGYTGAECEHAICNGEAPGPNLCSGHGDCSHPDICICQPNYSGRWCELPLCYNLTQGSPEVCSRRGVCSDVNTCSCKPGFYGSECENEFNCHGKFQSDTNVCSGRGLCLRDGSCKCDQNYTGEECQLNISTIIQVSLAVGFALLLLACIVITTVTLFCCARQHRRYKRASHEKELTKQLLQGFVRDAEMDMLDEDSKRANLIVKKAMLEVDFKELRDMTKIAVGGSGAAVFRATWNESTVAVKFPSSQNDSQFFERFENELSLMGTLRHRNIVTFLGCSLAFPRMSIITEFCENGSIENMIQNGSLSKTSSTQRLRMLLDIAEGCAYLHSRGVIHRDLKCANVLVDEHNVCKLTDFGLSKYTTDAQRAHTSGIGTSYYIAVECWNGDGLYSESIDTYSFGILCMELLLCRMCPFPQADTLNVLQIRERAAVDPLFRPDLSVLPSHFGFLKWMLQSCWDHDSSKRPPFRDVVKILKSSLYDVDER